MRSRLKQRQAFSIGEVRAESVSKAAYLAFDVLQLSFRSFFIRDVTKHNNTQNSINIANSRSNDAVQKNLPSRFSKLNLLGKSFEYRNKRSEKNEIRIRFFAYRHC